MSEPVDVGLLPKPSLLATVVLQRFPWQPAFLTGRFETGLENSIPQNACRQIAKETLVPVEKDAKKNNQSSLQRWRNLSILQREAIRNLLCDGPVRAREFLLVSSFGKVFGSVAPRLGSS